MLLSVSHDESLPADLTSQECSADSLVPAQTTHKQILSVQFSIRQGGTPYI